MGRTVPMREWAAKYLELGPRAKEIAATLVETGEIPECILNDPIFRDLVHYRLSWTWHIDPTGDGDEVVLHNQKGMREYGTSINMLLVQQHFVPPKKKKLVRLAENRVAFVPDDAAAAAPAE